MKKVLLVLALGLLTITSCEKDEDFNCECKWLQDSPGASPGVESGYPSDITDCNRHGELDGLGFDLRCERNVE